MDLGTLTEQTKQRVGVAGEAWFTNDHIRAWLNEGARDFARRTRCSSSIVTWSTVANQQEYSLPSDFYQVDTLYVSSTDRPLTPTTIDIIVKRQLNATGIPWEYYIRGDYIGLYPKPSSVETARMLYFRTLQNMTGTDDTPDIPARFHDFLVPFAAMRALMMDEEEQRAVIHKAEYLENVDLALYALTQQTGTILRIGQHGGASRVSLREQVKASGEANWRDYADS